MLILSMDTTKLHEEISNDCSVAIIPYTRTILVYISITNGIKLFSKDFITIVNPLFILYGKSYSKFIPIAVMSFVCPAISYEETNNPT